MRIGELANVTDTPVDTIRYYEKAKLLPRPARSSSNYRTYTERDVQRLAFIRRCRSLDMSLEEIRVLLRFCDTPAERCDEVNAVLRHHLQHVEQRVRELQQLEAGLRQLLAVCRNPGRAAQCGILKTLRRDAATSSAGPAAKTRIGRRSSVHSHVRSRNSR